MVKEQEERFVEFFNKAEPITTKLHQLELLPGIGKRLCGV
jgi:putative nucleotide binding protein